MESGSFDKLKMDGNNIKLLLIGNEADKRPGLLEELKTDFNFDFANPSPAYPYRSYIGLLERVRQVLHAGKSDQEAYIAIGEGLLKGYMQGEVGRVLMLTARLSKPEDMITMAVQNLGSATFNVKYEVEELRPNYGRVRMRNAKASPYLVQGVLQGVLKLKEVRNIQVMTTAVSIENVIYTVTWD